MKTLLIISLGIVSISPILLDNVPPPPDEPVIPEKFTIELPEDFIRHIIREELNRIEKENTRASEDAKRRNKEKLQNFRA